MTHIAGHFKILQYITVRTIYPIIIPDEDLSDFKFRINIRTFKDYTTKRMGQDFIPNNTFTLQLFNTSLEERIVLGRISRYHRLRYNVY